MRFVTIATLGCLAIAAEKAPPHGEPGRGLAAAQGRNATGAKPDSKEGLVRAQRYLAAWQDTLAAIVAEEDYQQSVRNAVNGIGTTEWRLHTTRRLRSDVL